MDRGLGPFPDDLEPLIRGLLAKEGKLDAGLDPSRSTLKGREVTFYENVWLGCVELTGRSERYYFLTRPRGRKAGRLIPISNTVGSVDRANRQYKLQLTRANVADYLNFYFSFTPREDLRLSRISEGTTQIAVPRSVEDFRIETQPDLVSDQAGLPPCSEDCLVRGAVWHYLDSDHRYVVPLRFRRRLAPPKVSGRIPIQFRHAVFAVDFRIPLDTGVPVLSNEELLFQSNAVREPRFPGSACLSIPKRITRFELWQNLRGWSKWLTNKIGRGATGCLWAVFAFAMFYFWSCAALFAVGEWWDWRGPQDQFEWWTAHLGQADWTWVAYWWTCAAIITFLWAIVLTTHRDKIFNWIFRLCPRKIQPWIVGGLDHFVTRWDDVMTAQHTFGKRAAWSVIHLLVWGAYLVAAFTSLQILSDLTEAQATRPPLLMAGMLVVQAVMNLPFIAFVLIQVSWLRDWVNPVAEGILDASVLWAFQGAMGFVVFKGLYRVWSYTVEASPYTFFRRMRTQVRKNRKAGSRASSKDA